MTLVQRKREEAGLSMSQVARDANMHLSTLWKIEHAQRKLKVDEVASLARAIGCEPADLIPALEEEPASAS